MILRMPRSWFPWGKRLELKKGMKEMNKRLWALLTALALLLPGCGGGGGENRPEIRVGLALYKEDDTFIEAITEGIHRAAAESSREGTWRASISVADAEGSQISQNQQIERFLSLGYDVLCVNLVDRTNAAPIIDKAMEADIPIVFLIGNRYRRIWRNGTGCATWVLMPGSRQNWRRKSFWTFGSGSRRRWIGMGTG